jgi:hypothetical protein
MAVTQLSGFRTAIRDIAIVTIFFAANIAISHYVRCKTIPGIGVTSRVSQPNIMAKARKFKLFTSLPVEIRELIYEHAICPSSHLSHPTHVRPVPGSWDAPCRGTDCRYFEIERL